MEDYYIAQFFCWREIILLNLEIDIETFSSVNLAKAGVYRYAESPDFEVLLFGYSVDGGEVKVGDLVKGEKIPEEVMSALEDEAVTKWAFNAQFERICISRMLGYEAGTYLVPASESSGRSAFRRAGSEQCVDPCRGRGETDGRRICFRRTPFPFPVKICK